MYFCRVVAYVIPVECLGYGHDKRQITSFDKLVIAYTYVDL